MDQGPATCSEFSLDYHTRLNPPAPQRSTVRDRAKVLVSPLCRGGRTHWRPAVAPGRHSRRSPPWSPGVGDQARILFPSPLGLKPRAPACLSSDSLWPWCRQSVARGLACDALCGGALFPVRGRWALSHRKPSGRKALAMGDPSSYAQAAAPNDVRHNGHTTGPVLDEYHRQHIASMLTFWNSLCFKGMPWSPAGSG